MTSGWHTHTCKTCGNAYQHEHSHTAPDHPQDDFQCPYDTCANFYKKGKSVRPPRNTRLMEGGEMIITAIKDDVVREKKTDTKPTSNQTNWEKTVGIAYANGEINCNKAVHFRKKKVEGSKWPKPERYELIRILGLMTPFKDYSCPCEYDATREAWSWNRPGTLQTEFVVNGLYRKGVGEIAKDAALKRVFPVQFRLTPAQFSVLHKRFPDWLFIQVGSGGHDHPISHITTEVVTFELFSALKGKCLDLHGNPSANERRNSRPDVKVQTDTYVNLVTPKDYYRKATKWGPQFDGAKARWHTGPYIRDAEDHMAVLLKDKNVVTGIHTGYYYEQSEIRSVLRGCKEGAVMELIMHRFQGTSGSFNGGELIWEKTRGHVVQTNAATGETYDHPDNDKWFTSSSWTDVPLEYSLPKIDDGEKMVPNPDFDTMRGLCWSTRLVCEGVYKVSIALCPAHAVYNDPRRVCSGGTVDSIKRSGEVTIQLGVVSGPISFPVKAQYAELFDELRTSISNCRRDEKKFSSHVALVKQKARAFYVDKKIDTMPDSSDISCMTDASFWIDFHRDLQTSTALHTDFQWLVKQHGLVLEGKALNKAGNVGMLALEIVGHALRAKSGKETSAAIIESLRMVLGKVL